MNAPANDRRKPPQRANDRPLPDPAGRPVAHDAEAELSINATLFAYPARWFDIAWMHGADFYDERAGLVYDAIGHVVADDAAVDPITVRARLEQMGAWERVGADHLTHTMQQGAINEPLLDRLAGIIVDKAKVRRVTALAQRIVNEGYSPLEDDRAWAEEAPMRFEAMVQTEGVTTGGTAKETITQVFAAWQNVDAVQPLRLGTGNPDLDRMFRGMRPKQLIVIGAHSGVGKSALAANIADHVGVMERPEGRPAGVYIISAEMSREEYIERMVFARAEVDTYKLDEEKRGLISHDEWARITTSAAALAVDSIYIDDRADVTPSQIRIEAKRVAMRKERAGTPLRLVVIDYAQIIEGDKENKRRHDNREQEIAQVARAAKKLAKELAVTVILLAQLNEDSVKEKRKPRASDLRESRSLKQDADKVLLIYNPSYDARTSAYRNGDNAAPLDEEIVDFIVDKNRGAKTGTVAAVFKPSFTRFSRYTGDHAELERAASDAAEAAAAAGRKKRAA